MEEIQSPVTQLEDDGLNTTWRHSTERWTVLRRTISVRCAIAASRSLVKPIVLTGFVVFFYYSSSSSLMSEEISEIDFFFLPCLLLKICSGTSGYVRIPWFDTNFIFWMDWVIIVHLPHIQFIVTRLKWLCSQRQPRPMKT